MGVICTISPSTSSSRSSSPNTPASAIWWNSSTVKRRLSTGVSMFVTILSHRRGLRPEALQVEDEPVGHDLRARVALERGQDAQVAQQREDSTMTDQGAEWHRLGIGRTQPQAS